MTIYEPGQCAKTDLHYLIELADRFNLFNERVSSDLLAPIELQTVPMDQTFVPKPKKDKMKAAKPL